MAGFGLAEGCGDGGVAGTFGDEAAQPLLGDGGVAATGAEVGAGLGWGSVLASVRRSFWARRARCLAWRVVR